MYRSTFFLTRHYLEVNGQLHASTTLPLGKEPPVPIGWEAGWTPEPVWTTWRKFMTLPGLELRPFSRPARSHSLYRLRYPCYIVYLYAVKFYVEMCIYGL
jgi:hypothetical protein